MIIELLNTTLPSNIRKQLKEIGCDIEGINIMKQKSFTLNFKIYGCTFYEANLLKQEALSVGADAALHRDTITARVKKTDCLLMGTPRMLKKLAKKLKIQTFSSVRELGFKLEEWLENIDKESLIFSFGNIKKDLIVDYMVMGILNVTPDSFSDGGLYESTDKALKRAEEMIDEGVDIIDVGGESTRPGADPVDEEEELRRTIPVIEAIKKRFDIPVSIDTYKSRVAKEALSSGADVVNDISGLSFDDEMIDVLKESNCGVIAMHIKGEPKEMQKNPHYEHLLAEINEAFENILGKTDREGIDRNRLVLDPGIGFGKTFEDNYRILNNLCTFSVWGRPLLIGTSRKSFIGYTFQESNPKKRLIGSIATVVSSYIKGARIFRVHDVKETVDALRVTKSILQESVN